MLNRDEGGKVVSTVKDDLDANTSPTVEQQLNYWKFWQNSSSMNDWALERGDMLLELLYDLHLDQPRILDFGCGTGWFTERLADFGQATGIDLNEEAIEEARSRWPHIRFIGGNLFEHPLRANSFDIVVSSQVIAHVEDQSAYIETAAKLLRPDGFLILSTNNKFVMDRLVGKVWGSHRAAGHIEKWLTVRSLKQLAAIRFHVLKTLTIIPLGNSGILRIVNSSKLNNLLEHLIPTKYIRRRKEQLGLGYYILLVARKRSDYEN